MEPGTATGLLTDRYELTMLSSFVADGTVDHACVFETFGRRLPTGRRYGLVAGLGRLLPLLVDYRFEAEDIAWLLDAGVITPACAAYLADFRFRGDVDALPEGDVYFPGTPVVTISGTLGECIVLETLVLSVINHDTAIASAAARMVTAARGRPLIEMGSRRTHEEAAVAAARAAYLAGFGVTSNLAAGRRHGVPTAGTAAHAFTLAHADELDAFRSQLAAHGTATTLLVDTYETEQGLRNAVTAANELGASGPGAVRLDSGDLAVEAVKARRLLDELGATDTRVTVTSDLDEYVIAALSDAPIDGYGVGTRVATGSGHPSAGLVYKLVAIADSADPAAPMRSVAKTADGKTSVGGRKDVWRTYDDTGVLLAEAHTIRGSGGAPPAGSRAALRRVMIAGEPVGSTSLEEAREHAVAALASLPAAAREIADGPSAITPTVLTGRALLVVDVQNDFCEGGSLAVDGGLAVGARISDHLDAHAAGYDLVVASRDWHSPGSTNQGHFAADGEDPDYATTWPVHCVAGTPGAEYAPTLRTGQVTHHVRKGQDAPAYSMFEAVDQDGTTLAALLEERGIGAVDVVGIAIDYCVRATVLDALGNGLQVAVLAGMVAAVAPATGATAVEEMRAAGARWEVER